MSTKKAVLASDPWAEREAHKYPNPIPSREFILQFLEQHGTLLTLDQLTAELGLEDPSDREALRRRLRAMEQDGQLLRNRKQGYGPISKMDLVRGRVVGHPDGFGFLIPDHGEDDIFLSARQMRGVLHGDRLMVQVTGVDYRGRREGAVVEVLERHNHRVVGRYHVERGIGFVSPDNKRISQDIVVPADEQGAAQDGQIAVVELLEQPTRRNQPVGRVVEILGDHMAPGMEVDIAVRAYELPHQWPQAVLDEVSGFSDEVPEEAKEGLRDLRHLPLVTIDGADAQDFDDAVFCERRPKGGWRLWVAIAHVSAYVRPGTALDGEAFNRGNSVYFPDRVIPMLPEVLSNGLCSLNPEVDRLCLVCELSVNALGRVTRTRFSEAVMRSAARLTYTEVAAMLERGDKRLRKRYADLLPSLEVAHGLYRLLRKMREKRGAIDFDTTETRIVFDQEKKIHHILPVTRTDAHRMIEEFMIAANVAAAKLLRRYKMPALYRIHSGPNEEKLAELRAFLAELGLKIGGGKQPEAKDFARFLEKVRGRPDTHLIQTVVLRSLSQAVYSPENIGHFGLAYPAYTHFTSPIRRYPDLLVHRAIRHLLAKRPVHEFIYSDSETEGFGEHCSMTERRADEATRDAISWLKCEYMLDKVGEEFNGTVSAATGFGLFVELDDIHVEGLVHVTALGNDYFHFDPAKHRLSGERTGAVYRLGDRLQVRVVRVDLDDRKIDFELCGVEMTTRQGRRKGKKKRWLR